MNCTIRARLSTMMALIYAVQGAWWPLLALHLGDLGFSGRQRGLIFATYPLAAVLTSLSAGSIVDRRLSSQRYLSACFSIGTLLLLVVASGRLATFAALGPLFLIYWLVSAPTYGVANSIAFRNLERPAAEFGRVRLWGTIGWMVVGWAVSIAMAWIGRSGGQGGTLEAFGIAAILSAGLAWFALRLPDTPPLAAGTRSTSLGLAVSLFRTPAIGLYLAVAFGVSLTTPFVYQVLPTYLEAKGLPRAWIATAMTLGQWPEIAALAGLPWLLRRFGYKVTLGLGIAAWLLRFATLAIHAPLWVALMGIPLHGIGIACFTVGGQVFLDARSPADQRAGAQATQSVVTSGLGSLAGSLLAGDLLGRFGGNYATVFLVPCLIHVGLIGLFILGFRPATASAREVDPGPHDARRVPRDGTPRSSAGRARYAMESADG